MLDTKLERQAVLFGTDYRPPLWERLEDGPGRAHRPKGRHFYSAKARVAAGPVQRGIGAGDPAGQKEPLMGDIR